jgi:NAD(P)-dependent dehydrogenase (short-subunit alcohol dehydrogenase family)/uncharacterized OB-fold protein
LLPVRQPAPMLAPRSRRLHGLTAAAAEGCFRLQVCADCATVIYPPRDACPSCLSADLPFRAVDPDGVLLAETTIRISGETWFRERAPWRIGTVRLDCGPLVVAHLHEGVAQGRRVRVQLLLDRAGAPAMLAGPAQEGGLMLDDRQAREFTCDPNGRRVLVTDGRAAVGQAMVAGLRAAGAQLVFVGIADPWKPFAGEPALRAMPGVEIIPLDVTDSASVAECAGQIGARVDILINTAEHVRAGGVMGAGGVEVARESMERRSLGLVRLAQSFGPILKARGAEAPVSACAFVNILSAHALMNWPEYGAACAAEAAALSLSQCLRAELRAGGIRVLNVFVGPVETEWFQALPPPKVAPATLAGAVIAALRSTVEECFVGDVAEDLRARLAANPKALERELGG